MWSIRKIAESDVTLGEWTLALTEIWFKPLMICGATAEYGPLLCEGCQTQVRRNVRRTGNAKH